MKEAFAAIKRLLRLRGATCSPLPALDAIDEPMDVAAQWFLEAAQLPMVMPTSAALATVDSQGHPRVRMVLPKSVEPSGVVFYTHQASAKGQELAAHPYAELLFYFDGFLRQIRVGGAVSQIEDATADAYFATRPRESQLGAWVSKQSEPLESRGAFDAALQDITCRFEGQPVPRPAGWKGYRVVAEKVELWQGRNHRLHDRYLFTRTDNGWARTLLHP